MDMKQNTSHLYETPELRFCDLELEGFLCQSRGIVGVDETQSFFGDSSSEDSGDLYFEYPQ